jgi:hypothetical protein
MTNMRETFVPLAGFKPEISAVKISRVSNIPFSKQLSYYSKEEYILSHFALIGVYRDAILSELSKNRSATRAFRTEATPVKFHVHGSLRLTHELYHIVCICWWM